MNISQIENLYEKRGWTNHGKQHFKKWIGRSFYEHWIKLENGKLKVHYRANGSKEGNFVAAPERAGLANTEYTVEGCFLLDLQAKYE